MKKTPSTKRPRTEYRDRRREMLTTAQAADELGISVKTMGYLHWKFLNPEKVRPEQVPVWMPDPVQGSKWTPSGVYAATDILKLDEVLDSAPVPVVQRNKKAPK